jgi:hypothetical protein
MIEVGQAYRSKIGENMGGNIMVVTDVRIIGDWYHCDYIYVEGRKDYNGKKFSRPADEICLISFILYTSNKV